MTEHHEERLKELIWMEGSRVISRPTKDAISAALDEIDALRDRVRALEARLREFGAKIDG